MMGLEYTATIHRHESGRRHVAGSPVPGPPGSARPVAIRRPRV